MTLVVHYFTIVVALIFEKKLNKQQNPFTKLHSFELKLELEM